MLVCFGVIVCLFVCFLFCFVLFVCFLFCLVCLFVFCFVLFCLFVCSLLQIAETEKYFSLVFITMVQNSKTYHRKNVLDFGHLLDKKRDMLQLRKNCQR